MSKKDEIQTGMKKNKDRESRLENNRTRDQQLGSASLIKKMDPAPMVRIRASRSVTQRCVSKATNLTTQQNLHSQDQFRHPSSPQDRLSRDLSVIQP